MFVIMKNTKLFQVVKNPCKVSGCNAGSKVLLCFNPNTEEMNILQSKAEN